MDFRDGLIVSNVSYAAHARGARTLTEIWAAAHVDEEFQIEAWGSDAEAMVRRAHRWGEMQSAGALLGHVRPR